ncbi:MAG: serine--tRNA ligase [Planctomycetes bacterium]|nr:serine--tRNA ligase [Planctomycetota bacterium]
MLDISIIRDETDKVRKAMEEKADFADVDALLKLDEERRGIIPKVEKLRARRNEVSKQINELKKKKQDAGALIEEMRGVGGQIKELEEKLRDLEPMIRDLQLLVPNIPAEGTPVGKDENDNVEVKHWGERKEFTFTPQAHWDLGPQLGILDFEAAAKIAGSGFCLYKGDGALLERALYNFMLDLHIEEHGYTEVFPPFLTNRDAITGTGQLPKLEEDMYRCDVDDFFLIPTAEVPVTNIHRDEILSHEDLPIYYTAYTACFRREAGAYGRDTRGLMRVHQFDKVEMVKFVRPETSYVELETLLQNAEDVLQRLGIEYRILQLCTGELSFAAAKCYDIEIWAPGIQRWLEVSSCSNFTDFQARRANIRFRDENGKVQFVHTLNGSGVALARLVLVLVEMYQREDGTIDVPEVLQPYMRGKKIIAG